MRRYTHIGALPFRLRRGQAEFLLISSRRSGRWIIPKGHWEAHETARAAALRESFEEGGICGVVGARPLGTLIDKPQKGAAIKLQVYPLRVTR
jgi:8-oxo-dGTP pyrophosphatase MutT (NUDIX family)